MGNRRLFTIGLLFLMNTPLLYVGAYLADVRAIFVSVGGRSPLNREAVYRIGGKVAKGLFAPANHVDRIARPWFG